MSELSDLPFEPTHHEIAIRKENVFQITNSSPPKGSYD